MEGGSGKRIESVSNFLLKTLKNGVSPLKKRSCRARTRTFTLSKLRCQFRRKRAFKRAVKTDFIQTHFEIHGADIKKVFGIEYYSLLCYLITINFSFKAIAELKD
jgi:hypothetical protein